MGLCGIILFKKREGYRGFGWGTRKRDLRTHRETESDRVKVRERVGLRFIEIPGKGEEEQRNQWEWRVPEENEGGTVGEKFVKLSPVERTLEDRPPPKPPFEPSRPLLIDLQASAVSDSNTRQDKTLKLHKDTRSRLQETDTLRNRYEASEGKS